MTAANDERRNAYDAIDRFLRNNMDDAAYAEYSQYLEMLYGNAPVNQCDGCQAGMPIVDGLHKNPAGDFHCIHMACQAKKYAPPKAEGPSICPVCRVWLEMGDDHKRGCSQG